MPNAQKHGKLQCLGVWNQMKTVKNHQQVSKMELLVRAPKNEVRQVVFWALPRQAPASPSQNGPIQSLPPPHTP